MEFVLAPFFHFFLKLWNPCVRTRRVIQIQKFKKWKYKGGNMGLLKNTWRKQWKKLLFPFGKSTSLSVKRSVDYLRTNMGFFLPRFLKFKLAHHLARPTRSFSLVMLETWRWVHWTEFWRLMFWSFKFWWIGRNNVKSEFPSHSNLRAF